MRKSERYPVDNCTAEIVLTFISKVLILEIFCDQKGTACIHRAIILFD